MENFKRHTPTHLAAKTWCIGGQKNTSEYLGDMPNRNANYRGSKHHLKPYWTLRTKVFIWLLVLLFVWTRQNFDLWPFFSPHIYNE